MEEENGKRQRNNKSNLKYAAVSSLLCVAIILGGLFSGGALYNVIAAEEDAVRYEPETAPSVEEAVSSGEGGETPPSGPVDTDGNEMPSYPEIEQETEVIETREYDGETFRVVCIGNSVTQHPYMSQFEHPDGYWLQDWGMAASAREKDYAHLLEAKMGEIYGETSLEVYNYMQWEVAEQAGIPRSAYLTYLDPLFEGEKGPDTDLVIIQLGESCTMYNSLLQDYADLIDYVRTHAPNAVIGVTGTVIIMDEARNAAVDTIKQMVCQDRGVPYISMSGYNESMWVGEGTVIYNEQGEATVISLIQRTHPGDIGMQYIADQIFQILSPYLPTVSG